MRERQNKVTQVLNVCCKSEFDLNYLLCIVPLHSTGISCTMLCKNRWVFAYPWASKFPRLCSLGYTCREFYQIYAPKSKVFVFSLQKLPFFLFYKVSLLLVELTMLVHISSPNFVGSDATAMIQHNASLFYMKAKWSFCSFSFCSKAVFDLNYHQRLVPFMDLFHPVHLYR